MNNVFMSSHLAVVFIESKIQKKTTEKHQIQPMLIKNNYTKCPICLGSIFNLSVAKARYLLPLIKSKLLLIGPQISCKI